MSDRAPSTPQPERFSFLHGVIFSLSTALIAEIVLGATFFHRDPLASLGRLAVVFLAFFAIYRFALTSLSSFKQSIKNLICLNIVLLGSIIIIWVGRIISISLANYAQQSSVMNGFSADSLAFAIPYATGALILQAILGIHYGMVFAICLALILGLYFPSETILVPYTLSSCLVACLSLSRFRARSAYIKAGFNVAIISLPFALASILMSPSVTLVDGTMRISGAVLSGILCTFLSAGLSPVFEYLGGYVTDMRLIEMATLDHPLLKELSIQAPGTWNHSMVMGMMVESASDAVGANPVVARVGAYFHDIGKMKKPLYFVENQAGEENRHGKLSPSMSALIIRAHVKDGIELARKHGLPKVIEDMIPQHHGTSLIEYFYNKATKEAEESHEESEVDRSLYTYPGPKPQTKEAGILMLADGIEAAARTLSEPTADRIQGMVQKLINKIFSSGELNECELTLNDLHLIAKSFTRILTGIYHQRIAYAEPAEKIREQPREDGHKRTESPDDKEAEKPRSEDLKRLGI